MADLVAPETLEELEALTSQLGKISPYCGLPASMYPALIAYLLAVIAKNGGTGGGGGGTGAALGYAGVEALRGEATHTGGARPSIAYLVWSSEPGDAGQGWFYWSETEDSDDDSGGTVIRADNNPYPALGAWVRLS